MRVRQVIGACSLALVAISCSLGGGAQEGTVNVSLSVDKATLPIGESLTIEVAAQNIGYEPLTLTGPSDCLLFVEILSTQGTVVWHSNGTCAGGTVTESVGPGLQKVQTFTWDGTNLAGARLPSGFYNARGVARVTGGAQVGPLRSIALE